MPVVDVFIAFRTNMKVYNSSNGYPTTIKERDAGGDILPIPNWNELKNLAASNGSRLNIYTEDDGTCNTKNLLKSLTTRLRIVVFAGHGWTDGRLRSNGTIEVGGGIRVGMGQAIGTFGITQAKTDRNGRAFGQYSSIPIIKASKVFIFSCNPGTDFRNILRTHLSKGSIGYYTNAGTDSVAWIPSLETGAYAATKSLILNQEAKAVYDANNILQNQAFGYSNGDRLMQVFGTR